MAIALRAVGWRSLALLLGRITRRTTAHAPDWRPGDERWFLVGGVVAFVGVGVAALLQRSVGYVVAALGMLLLAYAGVQIAADRNGAADRAIQRFWTDQGLDVRGPRVQIRIIGTGMMFVGLTGAIALLYWAFSL